MIELNGKYASAKVFSDIADQSAISQVIELLNQPYTEGSRIRMMPDIHAGAGCTVGTTMTVKDKICPNLVGVDIGCGMETVRIREDHIDLPMLDRIIRENIPSGFDIRKKQHHYADGIDLGRLVCGKHIDTDRASLSIGTLGGGNHFIEADRDDDGNIYIVVHSGSRHLGLEIANFYQEQAYKNLTSYTREEIDEIIETMKREGQESRINKALKSLKKKTAIPKALAYAEGHLFDSYISDMKTAQHFASLNRRAMMDIILKKAGLHAEEQFTTIHNYIDTDAMILRKGAVSAKEGERLLIPINMRDGSLVCTGKGNEDWNYSAPHGAGRLMSRGEAKQSFTLTEFKKQMEGIYTTSVSRSTIDECPMAYKNMDDIVSNIGPTARIDAVIKPIYNFKAAGDE